MDKNLANELRAAGYSEAQIEREMCILERIEAEEREIAEFQEARFVFTEYRGDLD